MDETDILHLRLHHQLLLPGSGRTVTNVVERMGALQAQDYAMMKWAVGSRVPGSTEADVENALNAGELLRTHVLRPTWHVVSPKDIRWMLALTAQRIRNKMKPRDKQLGLTDEIINRSKTLLVKALEAGEHLTKEDIDALWNRASIPTTEYRDAHLLMHAELDGLVCSGKTIGNSRSYALMEERAPIREQWSKEEALYKLAKAYFQCRWPATLQDFAWWSGLAMGDVRLAVSLIQPEFRVETIGEQVFLLADKSVERPKSVDSIHLLPAFDEFIIAYRERSATLLPTQFQKVVTTNGFFRPAVLHEGKVVGTWKRIGKKEQVDVECSFFQLNGEIPSKLSFAIEAYKRFQTAGKSI